MYFSLLFFSLLKVTKIFVLCVSSNCDIRDVRTTTVRDVKMMYSQERYMENVPLRVVMVKVMNLLIKPDSALGFILESELRQK